ncbi:MAG TPA: hypothetical protein VF721_11275 [Pyrinomonadaceae bacterium]|jgi:TolB protein
MNLELNMGAPKAKFTDKRIISLFLALFLLIGFSAADVSAENGKIAYAYGNAVYKMNPDGTGVQQLTFSTYDLNSYSRDFSPVWSPDGTKIAFVRLNSYTTPGDDGGWSSDSSYNTVYTYGIYTIDANGANLTRIKSGPAFVNDLAWSPDGTTLAYVQGGDTTFAGSFQSCGGNTNIYTIEATEGGEPVLIESAQNGIDPSWSPDGTKIYYAVNNTSAKYGIYSVDLLTTAVQRLTFDEFAPADPEASPDGSKIAYAVDYAVTDCLAGNMSTMGPTRVQVYNGSLIIYNISQNSSVIITNRASSPVWHPGGNLILFVSALNGAWSDGVGEPDLSIITPDGHNLTMIQNWQTGELTGSWSP